MITTLAALAMNSDIAFSPFIVPVAGCIMILGIVLAGIWSGIRNREIQSTERLAAIAKGVPIPATVEELALIHGKPSADSTRRRRNVRLAGLILVYGAVGLAAFFVVLASILHERDVLSGAAVGLIPLGIGIAMLIEVRIQTREIDEASSNPPRLTANPDRSL
ncbi:MAG: hypothetical protein M3R43_11885 [Acidobacteriota bacterium]|nr:hypothetical protein [Acidobacteriota bacterium]